MKKIGIITFHNSYNCGSMMESYAICKFLNDKKYDAEIIDYSSDGQKELYSVMYKNNTIKNIIKNIIIFPWRKKIKHNNYLYEEFKKDNLKLSSKVINDIFEIDKYDYLIAGSDQIWNITIPDASDYYFLPWKTNAKKIAYAPSFGARNIVDYSKNADKYANYIKDFNALSVREENGKKWIKDLTGKDAQLLIDPTLLLKASDYNNLINFSTYSSNDYIFFYCPDFNIKICKFVKKVAKKYKLKVVTWSTKSFYKKLIWRFGFNLVSEESPSIYLSYIKNAKLIITTSFHGTIFSTIFKKNFFVIKNGDMFGNDDRVKTLIKQLKIEDRLIDYVYDKNFDYLRQVDYSKYDKELPKLQKKAELYLLENIGDPYESTK